MAKFLVLVALASCAAAIDPVSIGAAGLGGVNSVGVTKQVNTVGPLGVQNVGVTKQINTVGGVNPLGLGVGGVGVGTLGLGGVGVSKQVSTSSVGTGLGGVSQTTSVNKQISSLDGLGGIGTLGWGGPGTLGLTTVNRLGVPSLATIPGGYYGGVLAYPQVIPTTVSTTLLNIPGTAIDAYRGYYGGYYPGSIGYGQSYRFFH